MNESSNIKYCQHCGHAVQETEKYCSSCGKELIVQPVSSTETKPKMKKWPFFVAGGVILLVIGFLIFIVLSAGIIGFLVNSKEKTKIDSPEITYSDSDSNQNYIEKQITGKWGILATYENDELDSMSYLNNSIYAVFNEDHTGKIVVDDTTMLIEWKFATENEESIMFTIINSSGEHINAYISTDDSSEIYEQLLIELDDMVLIFEK